MAKSGLRKAFSRLEAQLYRNDLTTAKIIKAERFQRKRVLRKSVLRWLILTKEVLDRQAFMVRGDGGLEEYRMGLFLSYLRKNAPESVVMTRAVSVIMRAALYRAVSTWRHVSQALKQRARITQNCVIRFMRIGRSELWYAVNLLREIARNQIRVAGLVRRVLARRSFLGLSRPFRLLRLNLGIFKRYVASVTTGRNVLLRSHLRGWKTAVGAQRRQLELLRKATRTMMHGQLFRYFDTWLLASKERDTRQKSQKGAALHYMRESLRRGFRPWFRVREDSEKQATEQIEFATSHYRKKALASGTYVLCREALDSRRNETSLLMSLEGHELLSAKFLSASLEKWKYLSYEQGLIESGTLHMHMSSRLRAIFRWRQLTFYHSHAEKATQAAEVAFRLFQKETLSAAWRMMHAKNEAVSDEPAAAAAATAATKAAHVAAKDAAKIVETHKQELATMPDGPEKVVAKAALARKEVAAATKLQKAGHAAASAKALLAKTVMPQEVQVKVLEKIQNTDRTKLTYALSRWRGFTMSVLEADVILSYSEHCINMVHRGRCWKRWRLATALVTDTRSLSELAGSEFNQKQLSFALASIRAYKSHHVMEGMLATCGSHLLIYALQKRGLMYWLKYASYKRKATDGIDVIELEVTPSVTE